ncbi:hypothetical protein BC351_30040 [Paenibacillus ferrarius]|uniref:Uncharacterized protein n=1 Tax=Paenibacillus ferrarius TaxID=1469647 RepID=A0A1V4HGT9_9BACL|nr:hypothetical protein [Paenibacillus ferrarius]OPH54965.1 hypothetical protein BC351_30040 [Paenibacillus ferrarius]
MIDFLKVKGIKAYNEIIEIAEQPNLLFSNDSGQYNAEANYNLYTIQKLNKLIKKNSISICELEKVFIFVETSWSAYLNKHYKDKSFLFYIWGDCQIPAIRLSIVSFYEGLELPFGCILNKVKDIQNLLIQYKEKAQFDGITIIETDESDLNEDETESEYILTVYSKIIKC